MLYGDGLRGDSPQTPGTLQVSNGLNVAMFKSHTMLSPLDVLAVAFVGWLSYRWYLFTEIRRKIDSIPTVGYDGFIGSYLSSWKYVISGHAMLEEGYKKYPGGAFKIATFETSSGWTIFVSGTKLVDDLRRVGDSYVSSVAPMHDMLKVDYTFGPGKMPLPERHHMLAFSKPMTRNMDDFFDGLHDEIVHSFDELVPATSDWTGHSVTPTLLSIIARTSNRVFVGLPLCRDQEYSKIHQDFPVWVILSVYAITISPSFLRPLVAYLTSPVVATEKRVTELLGPIIQERMRKNQELGKDWAGKPNDLISWLLDGAPEEFQRVDDVVLRVMVSNFAAIHTTTTALANVFFCLAAYQEYIAPLRAEVEEVVRAHGWTKGSMARMVKLDSFMKEVGRAEGNHITSAARKAIQDFTFSNGLTIPTGYTVSVVTRAAHNDPAIYENPDTFDGYRFLSNHSETEPISYDEDPSGKLRQQMVSLDPDYFFFGIGRHACPGRWFAVNEMKAIVAHVLMNYDLKLPDGETKPPPPQYFGTARSSNRTAQVLFRKRRAEGVRT